MRGEDRVVRDVSEEEILSEVMEDMLPEDPVYRRVAEEVVRTRFKTIGPVVLKAMEERPPIDVIKKGLAAGMDIAGKLYSRHIIRITEIMMAAKTMEIGISLAEERVVGGEDVRDLVFSADRDPHDTEPADELPERMEDMETGVPISAEALVNYMQCKPRVIQGTSLMTSTMKPFPDSRNGD